VAMLLPALQKARLQANIIKCQSGARQVYLAVTMYCNDNKNYYPHGQGTVDDPLWHVKLVTLNYMKEATQTARGGCPDGPTNYYTDIIGGDYWVSPMHPDPDPEPGFPVPSRCSYGLNGILQSGNAQTAFRLPWGPFRRISPIVRKHENDIGLIFCSGTPWYSGTFWDKSTAVLDKGGSRNLYPAIYANAGYSWYFSAAGFGYGPIAGRHRGKGTPVLYCDGHVGTYTLNDLAIYPWVPEKPLLYWSEYWLWYSTPQSGQ